MGLPPTVATSVLQQHINAVLANHASIGAQRQVDGTAEDTSDEDPSDISDDNLDNDEDDDENKVSLLESLTKTEMLIVDWNLLQEDEDEGDDIGAEEEPLNSDDDVSEEEQADLFDTDNVIVCQYDKVPWPQESHSLQDYWLKQTISFLQITRSRNKWKFYLKDGIMNIGGKDYIFQKSNGDAEW